MNITLLRFAPYVTSNASSLCTDKVIYGVATNWNSNAFARTMLWQALYLWSITSKSFCSHPHFRRPNPPSQSRGRTPHPQWPPCTTPPWPCRLQPPPPPPPLTCQWTLPLDFAHLETGQYKNSPNAWKLPSKTAHWDPIAAKRREGKKKTLSNPNSPVKLVPSFEQLNGKKGFPAQPKHHQFQGWIVTVFGQWPVGHLKPRAMHANFVTLFDTAMPGGAANTLKIQNKHFRQIPVQPCCEQCGHAMHRALCHSWLQSLLRWPNNKVQTVCGNLDIILVVHVNSFDTAWKKVSGKPMVV